MPYEPWNRPTGETLDAYDGHEAWVPVHWAWEFLRRNEKFQDACSRIQDDANAAREQRRIAEEFGLRRFKDYRDEFNSEIGKPKFVGRIRVMSNPSDARDDLERSMRVRPASVLIAFDLSAELQRKGAVDAQISAAAKVIKKALKKYLKRTGKQGSVTEGPEAGRLLRDLRILDLLDSRAAPTQLEAIKLANGGNERLLREIREGDKQVMRDKYKYQVTGARDLASDGYRLLAMMTK